MMMRIGFAAAFAAATLTACAGGMGGGISGSASVSVKADIKLPIADMPQKYASWVVEAEGYLWAVNEAYGRFTSARADLAAALGVDDNAAAIAGFIRDSIKVETKMTCQPPSFKAGIQAECTAEANARASGKGGNGQASGEASAGIQANCEAKAGLSLKPGGCTIETTTSEHPLLSNKAKWAKAEAAMQVILQLNGVNAHLNGRGDDINGRGMQLHVESVTDLAGDPTLALKMNNIQAELKKGAEAAGEANDKQGEMNSDLGTISDAINAQFPGISASISAG